MDIDVELIAIDGGGVFLDGGEIRARIITMEGTATSPGKLEYVRGICVHVYSL